MGKATKAQLIAWLEENDPSRGLDPVPAGSSQTPPGSISGSQTRQRPGSRQRDVMSTRPCYTSSDSSRAGSSPAELRRLEIKLQMKELEVQDREKERQDRERQRQHELAMEEQRSQGAPAAVSGEDPRGPGLVRCWEKLMFTQYKNVGDMDGFLSSFERACELLQIPSVDRLQQLTPLLDQEAAGVLNQLENLQPGNYEWVKEALLHKFGLTPETYRKKFWGVQKEPRETYVDMASHLLQYCCKWVLRVRAQTTEDLLMLMMLKQFYEVCPPSLRLWLKERRPEDPHETGKLVDEFTESWSGCEWESQREWESYITTQGGTRLQSRQHPHYVTTR